MLAYAFAVVMGVVSVADVASPRPTGWVADQAHVLDAGSRAELERIATALDQTRGVELAIVVVDSVPGVPKAFAHDLFERWRIGNAATNTGVLVLLVMANHRLEIETGSGIEVALGASWLADMEASTMVPRFKR